MTFLKQHFRVLALCALGLSTASAQAGLDGLFLQMQFRFGSFQEDHYFFLPDGRYYKGVPEGGLTAADLERACAKAPDYCGKYAVAGGKLALTPRKGQPNTLDFTPEAGGNLRIGGIFAKRVAAFPANAKLDGTYTWLGNTANVSAARSFTFHPDGTFTSGSLGGISTRTVGATSQSAAGGTYRLAGNTLELTANGQTSKLVAYPYDLGKGDVRLNLNGSFYKKQ